ncbi:MAG TPA: BamA/TamA family outer membrane protein [Candidatus Krumholzibacteria bacterium]
MRRSVGFILAAVACLAGSAAHAQYPFGKNKVIYQGRDWRVLQTEHVDVYHYAADSTLILYVAPLVESTFQEFNEVFRLEFSHRLPFVLYATHYDFQQTNILPSLISEYTGGFTDLMKGRIAVPANGSYSSLRHVVRHEMVHAFMLEKLKQVMDERGKYTYNHPPLWFTEGMAEYIADSPQTPQGEMFVRDALLNSRLYHLDEIWRIEGSYMMYKQGEAILNYIGTNYGKEAVVSILENWWVSPDFSQILERSIGVTLFELDEGFQKYAMRKYFPSVLEHRFASDLGKQLTPDATFYSRPTATVNHAGQTVISALSARDGRVVITDGVLDEWGTWKPEVLLGSGRSGRLESIPAFRSKLEAHGDTLLFVAKHNARDRLYMWNRVKNKEIASWTFGNLTMLQSPTLSHDRTRIVFSAIESLGRMDLFMLHVADGRVERLTEDGFSEEDPDFHPGDDVILFTSDRSAGDDQGRSHIYEMVVPTREIIPVEGGPFADSSPEWSPDGKSFLFVSDRDGIPNVYLHTPAGVTRQTNVATGVNVPSFLPGGKSFVASVYERGEFHTYKFPLHEDARPMRAALPPDSLRVPWSRADVAPNDFTTKPYSTKFGIDFVGAGIAIDPAAGDVGNGGQLVMTDILGNHQINFIFGTTTDQFDRLLDDFNIAASYTNLAHHLHYSVAAFNLNTYTDQQFLTNKEKRTGGGLAVSYPLSKFDRIEASTLVRRIEKINPATEAGLRNRDSITGSLYLTAVRDNTLWTFGGPLLGWRFYVTGGPTLDFRNRGFDSTLLQFDVRHYVKIGPRAAIALRYINRTAWGGDDLVFYMGGPWTLRGYNYNEFFGRTMQLFNTEIRFPLLDGLRLGFPFGPVEFPMFRGALFFDAGKVNRNQFEVLDTEWLGTLGVGAELNLGFAPVFRVNFTWATDFDTIANDTGFELFIGYNY